MDNQMIGHDGQVYAGRGVNPAAVSNDEQAETETEVAR